MAKNYTFKEAVEIIAKGKDLEAITDLGRRFPLMAHKVAVVVTKGGDDFVELMHFMPDHVTANKINSAIKSTITGEGAADAEDDDTDAAEETADEITSEVDYESMNAKQLWEILGKAGLRKTAKSTKKPDLVAACKAMDAVKDEEPDEEEEVDTNPYEGKSAMELFKECKKRGIKAEAKKPAKFYANLLIEADNVVPAEEDDWGEDETDVETPAPTKKKTEKPAAKPENKKAKPADDDDGDWDI